MELIVVFDMLNFIIFASKIRIIFKFVTNEL